MSEQLFHQNTLFDERLDDKNSFALTNEQEEVIGMIATKKDTDSPKTAWIQFLLIDKKIRGQGLGTKMLDIVEVEIQKNGVDQVFLGRDMYHYFPGIPVTSPQTMTWFEKKGYVAFDTEYDLINRYEDKEKLPLPTGDDVVFDLVQENEREELRTFMQAEFPGRWTQELKNYYTVNGDGREFVVAKKEDKMIGFCRINDKYSPLIAPNTYWSSLESGQVGGIGPLGIAEAERGNGYGLSIVEAGIVMLRNRDMDTIIIDWTGLVEFYGKLGYQPWKTYQAYRKKFNK